MKIESRVKNYDVEMADAILQNKQMLLDGFSCSNEFYFIDENVYKIYQKEIDVFTQGAKILVIEAHETNKEYIKLAEYYSWLIEHQFTRKDVLITIGGGILQDISGFIASTLYRGMKWIFLPTTLLAQADSCIGSKTSINFKDSKNLIGSFYPPDRIFIDSAFCKTLTPEYFNSGVGEVIKFHLLSNQEGYKKLKTYIFAKDGHESQLLKDIIWSTLNIKRSYFEEDEFDTDRRNLLNYGHCFGHALESASHFEVCHGEGVLVGMSFADLLSLKRGAMSQSLYGEFQKIYEGHYPDFDLSTIAAEEIVKYLKKDKKRVGKDLTMVIGEDIGKFHKCDNITEDEVHKVYQEFLVKWQTYRKLDS
ncbi:MAG: iron-containing alcohol dehydrogenase [Candidatus Omnitrophica bacterium]|nr:iron-containing alcohol dehydrogenase [Candidatus Omnitrophota bacterium]